MFILIGKNIETKEKQFRLNCIIYLPETDLKIKEYLHNLKNKNPKAYVRFKHSIF